MYSVKDCLTKGIQSLEQNSYVATPSSIRTRSGVLKIGKDVFETEIDAKLKAESLRLAEIKKLERQLERLKKLSFL
ncbi:MAG: hypothetical protein ACRCYD_00280 [Plesiomonas sp.]